MIIIRLLVITVIALSALTATKLSAQQATVRSGEHDSFSRVVVHLANRVPWTIRENGETREILFETAPIDVDVSRAFDRLSSGRIASIAPLKAETGLEIRLNCDCELKTFWHGRTMLVIDVHDSRQSLPYHKEVPQGTTDTPIRASPHPLSPTETGYTFFAPAQETAVTLTSKHLRFDLFSLPEGSASMHGALIDQARLSIESGLSRAKILGLVEAEMEAPKGERKLEAANMAGSDDAKQAREPATPVHPQINLGAYTSADPEIMENAKRSLQNVDGEPCLDNNFLDVGTWGTDASFVEQIGIARRALIDESDGFSHGSPFDSARLYLFFGFGAEAAQIIESAKVEGHAADVALAMAQLIDLERTEIGIFKHQMACPSDVALWSTLSTGVIGQDHLPNIDAILRALDGYPDHLKSLLGSRVARILTAGNRAAAAARILRLLDRQPGLKSAQEYLAHAEVDSSPGHKKSVDRDLKAVVESNSEASAEALIHRIDNWLQAGEPVPFDMAELAGAYAKEQRGTKIGSKLTRTYIQSLAGAGLYDLALEKLIAERPSPGDIGFERVADTVASYLVVNADDITFLKHVMPVKGIVFTGFSGGIDNRIAKRLLDLGFPAEAQTYLTGNSNGNVLRERLVLRAEANLAQASPREAMINLLSINGYDVDVLKAQAHSQLGEHQDAHLLYVSAGRTDEARREALLAVDAMDTNETADPVFNPMTGVAVIEESAPQTGVLAHSRQLIAESVDVRQKLSNTLVSETDATDDEG